MTDLEQQVYDFGLRLGHYIEREKVPRIWFQAPDHALVMAEDISDFQQLVDRPQKERVFHNLEEEERFDVSAKIAGALSIGQVGRVTWVEIYEPKDIDQIAGKIGLVTVKFLFSHFESARGIMGCRNIPYEVWDHGDHAEIHARFDDEDNWFVLSNRSLAELTDQKLKNGEAQELKLAA